MRVALIHSFYSSRSPSGENVVVRAQHRALERNGISAPIVAAHTDELENFKGYKFRTAINVARSKGISPLAQLHDLKPDIVHVHNLFPNFGLDWLSAWDGPVVATLHNYRPACAAGTLFRDGKFCRECPDYGSHRGLLHACYKDSRLATLPLALRTRRGAPLDSLLQRANQLIVLSSRARNIYRSLGVDDEKLQLIPNFVEDHSCETINPDDSYWVYIGRLSVEKGVLNLLSNWPADQPLRIYGDGPLRDDVMASNTQNIRFMGAAPHAEIPKILAAARGLIVPSEWAEGAVPLTHVEALAAGRPTIAKFGNGAADDNLRSGAGWVFKRWEDLPAAICRDAAVLAKHSARARAHYEEEYSVGPWLQKTAELYNSLMERG